MLSYRCLLVASLWCEGGAGSVLLLDLFLRTWEGKKHVIVAAFFLPFSMKWILATANPQPTSVRLFCGYGWAAVLLLWSFGNFIPRQTLVCWVHGRVLSPSVCLPCVHALTHTHTHTHTHTPLPPLKAQAVTPAGDAHLLTGQGGRIFWEDVAVWGSV